MAQILSISVKPNQIMFPESQISMQTDVPLKEEFVQGAFQILGLVGRVRLSREGKLATWTSVEPIQEGPHILHVGTLLFSNGEVSEQNIEIHFVFVSSKARVPKNVTVYHLVRIVVDPLGTRRVPLGKPTKEKFIEIMKTTNNRTDEPMELAYDSTGNPVDSNKIFKKINQNRVRKFGKLHETLYAHLEKLSSSSRADIAIWIRLRETEQHDTEAFEKTPKISPSEIEERKQIEAAKKEFEGKLQRDFAPQKIELDAIAPVVYTTLTKKQITEVTTYREVGRVFLHETGGIPDLNNSISVANSDDVHSSGVTGSGVKVAAWEWGPDKTDDLEIAEFYDPSQGMKWKHGRLTHAIIKNIEKEKPHGHAPTCVLYSANDLNLKALTWAVQDKECTVINQSFHRGEEPGASSLQYDDIYKDWLILHWPYPTIIQAVGNFWKGDFDNINPPENEYVNHKGYNSLSVGNHDDIANTMSGDSVFRNPSSAHGDRELPELCANGTDVTAAGVTSDNSGTSFAAPAVAGVVSLLQSIAATLKIWPEACRAILLAGARINVRDNTWYEDVSSGVDGHDGAGALDAQESAEITKNRSKKNNTPATQRGWDIGTLISEKFDKNHLSNFSYNVKIPSIGSSKHVKIALAWNSKFQQTMSDSVLTDDFDILVHDSANNLIGSSESIDNSYEIAEFDGKPGKTYKIRVKRTSGTDWTWYGIAWTVV
jgi:hypothetical protein